MTTYAQTLNEKAFFGYLAESGRDAYIFGPDELEEKGFTLAVEMGGGKWFGLESARRDVRTFATIDAAARLAKGKGVAKLILCP